MAADRTLQDFWDLGRNVLVDYLAVRGLRTSGTRAELVARAFSAAELQLPIIRFSEEQQAQLKTEYEENLKLYNIPDPLTIKEDKKSDDITMWPPVHCGTIYSYILKVRDFDVDYVGRYKDQKAYSYWLSGFVDTIYTYQLLTNKNYLVIYGMVRASLTASVVHKSWILIQKNPLQILTCWCSCMAGYSQSCNHVIAVLYKMDHAREKGYLDPACTDVPCSVIGTKPQIEKYNQK